MGPYVFTKVISDVAYELQAHPKLRPKAVHVDYLKPCHAWASKDNWIRNPDYVCPPGRPRGDPDEVLGGVDDVLSDGEVDNLLKDCPRESPDMSIQQTPAKTCSNDTSKVSTLSRRENGTLNRAEKSTTSSGNGSHSTSSGSQKAPTLSVEDQCPTLSRDLERTKQTSRRVPTGKASRCELTKSLVHGSMPTKTRYGRHIKPPCRFA